LPREDTPEVYIEFLKIFRSNVSETGRSYGEVAKTTSAFCWAYRRLNYRFEQEAIVMACAEWDDHGEGRFQDFIDLRVPVIIAEKWWEYLEKARWN
jgi:hypothetical protein